MAAKTTQQPDSPGVISCARLNNRTNRRAKWMAVWSYPCSSANVEATHGESCDLRALGKFKQAAKQTGHLAGKENLCEQAAKSALRCHTAFHHHEIYSKTGQCYGIITSVFLPDTCSPHQKYEIVTEVLSLIDCDHNMTITNGCEKSQHMRMNNIQGLLCPFPAPAQTISMISSIMPRNLCPDQLRSSTRFVVE